MQQLQRLRQSFCKCFICECADTVLASGDMRVNKVNNIHVLLEEMFEVREIDNNRQTKK